MKEVKKTRNTPSREAARAANGVRHRKRRKRSYTLYYLLLLFFVLISGITLSLTVFFNIETIKVNGSSLNSAEQIINQSGIKKGNNLFRINPEKAAKLLKDNMQNIDSVRIERKFPSSLIINVTDAVPTYYVTDGNSYTVISEGNRILDTGIAKEQVTAPIRLEGLEVSKFQKGDFIDGKANAKLGLSHSGRQFLRHGRNTLSLHDALGDGFPDVEQKGLFVLPQAIRKHSAGPGIGQDVFDDAFVQLCDLMEEADAGLNVV